MCRINPKIDFAFKKLFGSEENKDLLISLINSIVNYEDAIIDVMLKNPYNLAAYRADKMSILDIKAVSGEGIWYNVEMQIGEDLNFDKRSIYYWSKMVTEQLSEGMFYKKLNKTISISILDFNIINDNDNFHNRYKILNVDTKQEDDLHDIFEMHYLELKKFKKDFKDIASALDRWITFLTKAGKLKKDDLPIELSNDSSILKAIREVDRMFDEEERAVYDVRFQSQMDFESKHDSALTKGMNLGLEKGRELGLEVGREKEKLAIAKNLLDILDNKTISQKTGLSADEIEKLRG